MEAASRGTPLSYTVTNDDITQAKGNLAVTRLINKIACTLFKPSRHDKAQVPYLLGEH